MTRKQRLDQLMREGLNGYDMPPYYPSGSPYMDDFTLGADEPAPPRTVLQQYWPVLAGLALFVWVARK